VPAASAVSEYVVPVGCAIRFAAAGVKPATVERERSYFVTPTSSVDALHVRVAVVPDSDAARPVGAAGGERSSVDTGFVMSLWISDADNARL
jgi:hypothetical protein